MRYLLIIISFILFYIPNVIANDPDECDAFLDNQYIFTQDTLEFNEWSFALESQKDEECIACPPMIFVDNFASDAGVNGLNSTQLLEINGENYLSYDDDENFLKVAQKIIEENKKLKIKAISDVDGNIWNLESLDINFNPDDYDFDLLEIEINKGFQSLIPVKFEIEMADMAIEEKSSNVSSLINIYYYYSIPKFSEYALDNIDFEICSFKEEAISLISEKLFIPKIADSDATANIQNFYNQDKKRKFEEVSFFKTDSSVDIYINETLMIESKPVSDFSKFPFDSLSVSIVLFANNFISKDFREEDWQRIERNTIENISLNEWNLKDIKIYESAVDKQLLFDFLEEDIQFSQEMKDVIKKTMNKFGVVEFFSLDYVLNRKYQFYTLKVVIPVFFIVLISFSTFWIRNEQIEAKLNLAIVSLLALIAYNFIVNNDIPKIENITVLDSFILISYLFTGFCSILSVYSYFDYRRDKLTGDFNPIDLKLRYIAPIIYLTSITIIGLFIYYEILFFS